MDYETDGSTRGILNGLAFGVLLWIFLICVIALCVHRADIGAAWQWLVGWLA
jgi:hypothetical protein